MNPLENRKHSPLCPPEIGQDVAFNNWCDLYGSADALAIVNAAHRFTSLVLVVTKSSREAEDLEAALNFYNPDKEGLPIWTFPSWECLPYDDFGPHRDIISHRIDLLSRLPTTSRGILLVSVDNLMQRLPPDSNIKATSLTLEEGMHLNLDAFRIHLASASYVPAVQVHGPGEFAIRGGVIDIFPTGADDPIRLELMGDQIDTLRCFDAETQLTKEKISIFQILPSSEVLINKSTVQLFRQQFRKHIEGDPRQNTIYKNIGLKNTPQSVEFYLPLFYEQTSTLFDYLLPSAFLFITGGVHTAADNFWQHVEERFESKRDDASQRPLPPKMLYLDPVELKGCIDRCSCVFLENKRRERSVSLHSGQPKQASFSEKSSTFQKRLLTQLNSCSAKTLIVIDNFGQRENVENVLSEIGIGSQRVENWTDFLNSQTKYSVTISKLASGLELPEENLQVISSVQLYGRRTQFMQVERKTRSPESIISSMEDLQIGEYVVHDDYGVGIYKGLITMDLTGTEAEFLSIQYKGSDSLYVPVYAFERISRYVNISNKDVEIHSLSSKSWNTSKRKAQEKAFDIAAELIEIQSLRDSRKGISMPAPEVDYREFISRFEFQETPDQQSSISAVLHDMKSSRPMDRLVCGDVGFGKTEVALRATLVAVANGYQVAVVTPTTLLAKQHYDVFSNRFSEQGIRIELFSRFRKKSKIDNLVAELNNGQIDIAIGTHRLLQSDVQFSKLGLLIIDEEHRFGVRQKEYLKRLRTDVDILTLTATPIPRTLSQALNEIRDISIIATPPENRLSVRTFVQDWSSEIVREACLRELGRGGQIFYVFNKVRTIQSVARELARIVPEAKIGIAHGQMPKLQLQSVMRNFYLQQFNLLVCSTIIESGIDIPTANTIIIDRASEFGLAQLHQLRGRVGRSHHQAYAYLLVPSRAHLRSDAKLRLEAIESFDQLGVGYIIATHDLEIRGAGSLLGEEQSGVINEVGYSLYTKYLKDAVHILKKFPSQTSIKNLSLPVTDAMTEIDIYAPTLLPESWIPDVNLRLSLYRKIAAASDIETLNKLKLEMLDRFGKFPDPVINLFHVNQLKVQSSKLGIDRLVIKERTGRIGLHPKGKFSQKGLMKLIVEYPGYTKFSKSDSSVTLEHGLPTADERLQRAWYILDTLTPSATDTVH